MKMRCVSVSDKKSLQRFLDVANYALSSADVELSKEQRKKFFAGVIEIVQENGFLISKQVSQ